MLNLLPRRPPSIVGREASGRTRNYGQIRRVPDISLPPQAHYGADMLGREHAQGREHAIGHPAVTDPQTGLANSLHFELVYSYLFAAGNRGVTFTVMLLSVGEGITLSRTVTLRSRSARRSRGPRGTRTSSPTWGAAATWCCSSAPISKGATGRGRPTGDGPPRTATDPQRGTRGLLARHAPSRPSCSRRPTRRC